MISVGTKSKKTRMFDKQIKTFHEGFGGKHVYNIRANGVVIYYL